MLGLGIVTIITHMGGKRLAGHMETTKLVEWLGIIFWMHLLIQYSYTS